MLAGHDRDRITSVAAVVLLHLLLGWALLLGLTPHVVGRQDDSLSVFDVAPPLAPPPPEPPATREAEPAPARPAGAPPPPVLPAEPVRAASAPAPPRDVPPPVAAGIVPASGGEIAPASGDPQWRLGGGGGAGAGAGMAGSGTGGGGSGGRGGGEPVTQAQLRSGTIRPRDYPPGANGVQGTVTARLAVSASGAVTDCTIIRSSGNDVLDATTCRLIRERFRFAPARDAQGHPVPDVQGWQQRWWQE